MCTTEYAIAILTTKQFDTGTIRELVELLKRPSKSLIAFTVFAETPCRGHVLTRRPSSANAAYIKAVVSDQNAESPSAFGLVQRQMSDVTQGDKLLTLPGCSSDVWMSMNLHVQLLGQEMSLWAYPFVGTANLLLSAQNWLTRTPST